MRLGMMGTGPFGVPTFEKLYQLQHEVVVLVTGPVRRVPGRRPVPSSPLRQIAAQHNTPIFDPEDVNSTDSCKQLARYRADLWVVCDYGQILSSETLATARLGGINIHGSLLPKYRGAAPVQWAIYHGETVTGVSIIHMTPQLDAGPIIAQASTPIGPEETAPQLERRLAQMAAELIPGVLDALQSGTAKPVKQNPSEASKAPRLKKTDGLVDWTRTAEQIRNHIRAMQPWPAAYTFWHRPGGTPLRLILGPVRVQASPDPDSPPGTVLEASGDRLLVATGEGAVALTAVQPAGKRMMPVDQFLRGYRLQVGHRLGPA